MLKYSAMMLANGLITPRGGDHEQLERLAQWPTRWNQAVPLKWAQPGEKEALLHRMEEGGPGLNGLVLDLGVTLVC